MNRSAAAAALTLVVALVGCGGDEPRDATVLDVPATVAIGVLPDPLTDTPTLPALPPPPTTRPAAPVTTVAARPQPGAIGSVLLGDRLLMIGDSLLASAAPRNDPYLCDALTLFGWEAEIDAEPDHDLDFVDEVLDDRLNRDDEQPWDVVALVLGNELPFPDGDAYDAYATWLDDIIDRLAPRLVLLYTVSEAEVDGVDRARLNDIIRDRPRSHPNVVIVDWAELGGDPGEVLDDTSAALTSDGRKRFALQTAQLLRARSQDPDGECLPTDYDAG